MMKRFRSTWLALMGGALLVTLSISAALGAAPAGTREATRGQTIAALVHGLVFDTEPDGERQVEEDNDEVDELDELDEEETDAHDECVAEVAEDPDAIGGTNDNHGGAVSEAARITCWETDGDEVADPDEEEEQANSHGACVSEIARDKSAVGGKNDNHGGAVSEAARVTCREDADETADSLDEPAVASDKQSAKAERQAAKAAEQAAKAAERGGGKPSWAGRDGAKDTGPGGGNGRGGGRR